MPSAYINQLNRELQDERTCEQATKSDLREQFLDWHTSLPEIARQRPFAMIELEQALGTQGKYLSPVLLSLGWQRKRRWTGGGQYPRYWLPPAIRTRGDSMIS